MFFELLRYAFLSLFIEKTIYFVSYLSNGLCLNSAMKCKAHMAKLSNSSEIFTIFKALSYTAGSGNNMCTFYLLWPVYSS